MVKLSLLLVAGVLACLGQVLALENDDILATPLFKDTEDGVSSEQRALLHEPHGMPGQYGGCNAAKKETFFIATNAARKYPYFRDRVLRKALFKVYAKFGYRKPQCSFAKSKYFPKDTAKVQLKLVCKYPINSCHYRKDLQHAVTHVVKHYAFTYKCYTN